MFSHSRNRTIELKPINDMLWMIACNLITEIAHSVFKSIQKQMCDMRCLGIRIDCGFVLISVNICFFFVFYSMECDC